MDNNQDNIDLQKLSQKELLIVTYRKVEELSEVISKVTQKQGELDVRLAVVETKQKMTSALYGGITGGIIAGFIALVFSLLK